MTKNKGLQQTSLLVLDASGNVYNFVLDYSNKPENLVYKIKDSTIEGIKKSLDDTKFLFKSLNDEKTEQERKRFFKRLLFSNKKIKDVSKRSNSILFTLYSIHADENNLYFVTKIKNLSSLDFEIDGFRVFVNTYNEKSKRKLQERVPLQVLDIYPNTPKIIKNKQFFVIQIAKRSVSKEKYLLLEAIDAIGDRNISLIITSNTLSRGKLINTKYTK